MLKTLEEIQKMSESNSWTNAAGQPVRVNEARSANRKAIAKNLWENKEIKFFRESFKKKWGVDFADRENFPVHEAGFNWNDVAKKCGFPDVAIAMKEADSGSNFTQVLRAGVQSIVNSMYESVPTTYATWTSTVNSQKDTELYAPLHGVSFVREVGKQEIYSESYAAGLDIKLKNRKYGTIFAVEKELLEDDQTGQFAKQASLLGEYLALAAEVICYAKLAGKFTGGVKASYGGMEVPNTETQPSDESAWPWSTALTGGGRNRPDTYTILNQAGIQNGFIGLMNQRNKLGLLMNVDPNRLVIGPAYRFDAAVLLNSSFYPSVPSGTAGATGASFAINPIESIAALTISRFMFTNTGVINGTSKAWYLVDDKKPFFVVQLRQAAAVEQENPTSGQSFDKDVIRFKGNTRLNADFIDPRFAWQGNDGSVLS